MVDAIELDSLCARHCAVWTWATVCVRTLLFQLSKVARASERKFYISEIINYFESKRSDVQFLMPVSECVSLEVPARAHIIYFNYETSHELFSIALCARFISMFINIFSPIPPHLFNQIACLRAKACFFFLFFFYSLLTNQTNLTTAMPCAAPHLQRLRFSLAQNIPVFIFLPSNRIKLVLVCLASLSCFSCPERFSLSLLSSPLVSIFEKRKISLMTLITDREKSSLTWCRGASETESLKMIKWNSLDACFLLFFILLEILKLLMSKIWCKLWDEERPKRKTRFSLALSYLASPILLCVLQRRRHRENATVK